MNALFDAYDVVEEVATMKQAMKNDTWIDYLESADTDYKEELIADVIDNVTTKALGLSGEAFVGTMSDAAVEFFAESSIYFANEGNFSMFNSAKWSYKKPHSNPRDAFKCAAQRGKCECVMGSTIYYGAKTNIDGVDRLDTSQSYFKGEADFSGSTMCKNSYFGDPLPGTSKYCFCDELSNAVHPVAEYCAESGENCECPDGNYVAYAKSTYDENGNATLDYTF